MVYYRPEKSVEAGDPPGQEAAGGAATLAGERLLGCRLQVMHILDTDPLTTLGCPTWRARRPRRWRRSRQWSTAAAARGVDITH